MHTIVHVAITFVAPDILVSEIDFGPVVCILNCPVETEADSWDHDFAEDTGAVTWGVSSINKILAPLDCGNVKASGRTPTKLGIRGESHQNAAES